MKTKMTSLESGVWLELGEQLMLWDDSLEGDRYLLHVSCQLSVYCSMQFSLNVDWFFLEWS